MFSLYKLFSLTIVVLSLLLNACGGGVSNPGIDIADSPQGINAVDILFPPEGLFTGESLTVSGKASDISGVVNSPVQITVNGEMTEAVVDVDGRWSARVTNFSANTRNTLQVSLRSSDNTILSDERSINIADDFIALKTNIESKSAVFDNANERLLTIDDNAIIAIDINSGHRTIFSNSMNNPRFTEVGEGIQLTSLSSMTLDIKNQRLLVVSSSDPSRVITVDLESGNRSLLSGRRGDDNSELIGEGPEVSIGAIFNINDRVLVSENFSGRIAEIENGNRKIITTFISSEDLDAGFVSFPLSMGFLGKKLVIHHALFKFDEADSDTTTVIQEIVMIDLTDSSRTIFSRNESEITDEFTLDVLAKVLDFSLTIDSDRQRLLTLSNNQVIATSLIDGERSVIFTPEPVKNSSNSQLSDIVIHPENDSLFVIDSGLDEVLAINLINNEQATISEPQVAKAMLRNPSSVVLDKARRRALVADRLLGAIIAIDISSGVSTVISSGSVGIGPSFANPDSMVFDSDNNRLLVLDITCDAVIAVDIDTGNRSVLSNAGNDLCEDYITAGSGIALVRPEMIALDKENARLLIADSSRNAIIAVALTSGDRNVMSGVDDSGNEGSTIGEGIAFDAPRTLVFDSKNNRLLVFDTLLNAIVAVDGVTGNRTIFSDNHTVDSDVDINALADMVIDDASNRLLVLSNELFFRSIISVDLSTGNRTVLSSAKNSNAGEGIAFNNPLAMLLDRDTNQIFVTDNGLQAVVSVSLIGGDRLVALSFSPQK